jgi:hypothetical protein
MRQTGIRLPLVGAELFKGRRSVHFSSTAAQAAGLRYRPLSDTAAATLAWWRSQPDERRAQAKAWPAPELEQEALRLLAGR